jgi:hypothetical protein
MISPQLLKVWELNSKKKWGEGLKKVKKRRGEGFDVNGRKIQEIIACKNTV